MSSNRIVRKSLVLAACPMLFMLTSSCDSYFWQSLQAGLRGDRLHPDADFFAASMEPTTVLRLDVPATEMTQPFPFNGALADVHSVRFVLGTFDGKPEETFGRLEDVAVDAEGRLYVLDSQNHEVRVFTATGDFLTVIGGQGGGPGELLSPRSVTVATSGEVLVGDTRMSVSVFSPHGRNGQFQFQKSFSVNVEPLDICIVGEVLYVHGVSPNQMHTIHTYDLNGEPLGSFSDLYGSENFMVNHQMSTGTLTCVEHAGTIVFTPKFLVDGIRGYRVDGTLAWFTSVSGYDPVSVVEKGSGTVSMEVPVEGMHVLASQVSFADSFVFLQFEHVVGHPSRDSDRQTHIIRNIVIDATSGLVYPISTELYGVVAAAPGFVVTTGTNPHPVLTYYRGIEN